MCNHGIVQGLHHPDVNSCRTGIFRAANYGQANTQDEILAKYLDVVVSNVQETTTNDPFSHSKNALIAGSLDLAIVYAAKTDGAPPWRRDIGDTGIGK